MGIRSYQGWQPYDASDRKTFQSALCHLLHTEFPGVFGPTITRLFADKIDELYERFHPPGSRFKLGQVLWAAVAVDDPPSHNKRIEDTRLVPIVLDLVTAQDIDDAVSQEEGGRRPGATRSSASVARPTRRRRCSSLADVSLLTSCEYQHDFAS